MFDYLFGGGVHGASTQANEAAGTRGHFISTTAVAAAATTTAAAGVASSHQDQRLALDLARQSLADATTTAKCPTLAHWWKVKLEYLSLTRSITQHTMGPAEHMINSFYILRWSMRSHALPPAFLTSRSRPRPSQATNLFVPRKEDPLTLSNLPRRGPSLWSSCPCTPS